MGFAGWINKATDTHSEYVTHRFSIAMIVRMHFDVMFIRTLPVSFTVLPGQQSVLERPRRLNLILVGEEEYSFHH